MSWYLGEEMCWSRGWTEGFLNHSNIHLLSTSSAEKKSEPRKGKPASSDLGILYPAPKILNPNSNFNTVGAKFSCWHLGINSFGTKSGLCWNCPAGTSELIPFGANSDIPWDWRIPEILPGNSSLIFPVGVYYASPLVGNYISPHWGVTMLLLSWGTT